MSARSVRVAMARDRKQLAEKVLLALVAAYAPSPDDDASFGGRPEHWATFAYELADAMCSEAERRQDEARKR